MQNHSIVAGAVMAATIALPVGVAAARPRPRFEPTDLEWEVTGVFEVDVEFGVVRSPTTGRLMVPDFELDFGITDNVELDLDGSYALESSVPGSYAFDRSVPSSLWPSLKIGVWDDHDYVARRARAIGIQFGPRVPIASGAHGIGFESLVIFGGMRGPLTVAVNLGAFAEPPADAASLYSLGVESGLDAELALDSQQRFTLTSEVAAAYFFTADGSQLHATAGLSWSAHPNLDLSIVGIVGFLPGDDRFGLLVGFEPKMRIFDVAPREGAPPRDKEVPGP